MQNYMCVCVCIHIHIYKVREGGGEDGNMQEKDREANFQMRLRMNTS